jgi:hypothetical protein
MADFIPAKDTALINWSNNYKTKIATHGPTLGLTAAQITAQQNRCTNVINAIQQVELKKNDWQSSVEAKETAKTTEIGALRTDIAAMKTTAAMTPAIAADLSIVGTPDTFDPTTFKTQLTVEVVAGSVRIKFVKSKTDGVNIYARLKGQSAWTFLARDTASPYVDTRPLAAPGVAEVREYMAFGVIDDAQIGQQSDIVSVTFGG